MSSSTTDQSARGARVAYIMSRFPKITETFVLYEMKALEESGAEVEVFPLLMQPPGPRHEEAKAYEERAHHTPFLSWKLARTNASALLRNPGLYLRTWWEMLSGTFGSFKFFLGALVYFPKSVVFAEQMRELGVTHVHAHFASHPALAALVVNRLAGIPYSFTAHGSDLHVDRRMLCPKVTSASFVVAVSDYNRRLIVKECGEQVRDKVTVIHCGTDPRAFEAPVSPDGHDERPGSDRSLRIVCVASFEEVKGHRFLIHACRMLVHDDVDVHVDLAGGGPLRKEITGLVNDLELEDRVTIHGPVPRPVVGRLLSEADVAVLASHPTPSGKREGIPVALMEAMMSGLPVVASRLSGIPELVEDGRTGYLVPSGNPRALADSLERLAGRPDLRRRMGAEGRAKVEAEFDLRVCARQLLSEIIRPREGAAAVSRDTVA